MNLAPRQPSPPSLQDRQISTKVSDKVVGESRRIHVKLDTFLNKLVAVWSIERFPHYEVPLSHYARDCEKSWKSEVKDRCSAKRSSGFVWVCMTFFIFWNSVAPIDECIVSNVIKKTNIVSSFSLLETSAWWALVVVNSVSTRGLLGGPSLWPNVSTESSSSEALMWCRAMQSTPPCALPAPPRIFPLVVDWCQSR